MSMNYLLKTFSIKIKTSSDPLICLQCGKEYREKYTNALNTVHPNNSHPPKHDNNYCEDCRQPYFFHFLVEHNSHTPKINIPIPYSSLTKLHSSYIYLTLATIFSVDSNHILIDGHPYEEDNFWCPLENIMINKFDFKVEILNQNK
jgi:hypothetical protein